uniref:Uncharacterized protein n=1 Tax=Romanomermis culicivorax TaxID=13658 RepID=A0A915IGA7_ROMCU
MTTAEQNIAGSAKPKQNLKKANKGHQGTNAISVPHTNSSSTPIRSVESKSHLKPSIHRSKVTFLFKTSNVVALPSKPLILRHELIVLAWD